jgi:hypothetical protein
MASLAKAAACLLFVIFFAGFNSKPGVSEPSTKISRQKIQVAILLDVSNSMDGLIRQAKAQLWNMVSTLEKVECSDGRPMMEIALYEYGRTDNDVKAGYVKRISGFTSDLDSLSVQLFALSTRGGEEYCGEVIKQAVADLSWDTTSGNYKVIFIAGNEDFLQGNTHYTKACADAKMKGIIVNTIYCGDRLAGIREHWDLSADCGQGSFTNISQDATEPDIATPYDSMLMVLNASLNNTYVAYNAAGMSRKIVQAELDDKQMKVDKKSGYDRMKVKGNAATYSNESWDLIDRFAADTAEVRDISDPNKIREYVITKRALPDSLMNKSPEELQKFIIAKKAEREKVNAEIQDLISRREIFITEERKKLAATANVATLETEVEKIIKQQVKRSGMFIK